MAKFLWKVALNNHKENEINKINLIMANMPCKTNIVVNDHAQMK